ADVADMGEGEGHDLPGIGGVGHDFLVAGHRGVEDQFGHGLARRAEALAVEERSVGQGQAGRGSVRTHGGIGHGDSPGHKSRGTYGRGRAWSRGNAAFGLRNDFNELVEDRAVVPGPACGYVGGFGSSGDGDPMDMREWIGAALKDAMKSKDAARLSTLRLINAAIKDKDIALRGEGGDATVGDAEVLAILGRMVKQRQESARAYEEGGRLELAEKELAEIKVIEDFL